MMIEKLDRRRENLQNKTTFMNQQWKQLLSFIRITGERVIVMDPEGEELMVVLPLKVYEKMISQGEINNQKEVLLEEKVKNLDNIKIEKQEDLPNIWEKMIPASELIVNQEEKEQMNIKKENKIDEKIQIKNQITQINLEDEKKQVRNEGMEEQFYLEPIE
jgi:hypothetical protein